MRFNPALGSMVFRTGALDLTPEPGGVNHLPQVRRFMQNQIITDQRLIFIFVYDHVKLGMFLHLILMITKPLLTP
jgi:hypothetical protein